jgi:hypothetical protein
MIAQPPRKSTGGVAPRKQLASHAARKSAAAPTMIPQGRSYGIMMGGAGGGPDGVDDLHMGDDDDDDGDEEEEAEADRAPSSKPPVADTPETKLERLVDLQTFSGAWPWGDDLLVLLGLDKEFAAALAVAAQLPGAGEAMLATALVLAFLEEKLKDKEEEWEMLAEKARGWLSEELRTGGLLPLEAYCEEARKFLRRGDGSLLV